MSHAIQDEVILITGANRGIGKVLLEGALQRGAKRVYAAVRRPDSVEPLVQKYGDRVVPLQVDLQDPASIARAAQEASDVEVVINNAGVLKKAHPLSAEAIEALQFEIDVNVAGLIRIAQAFAPVLKQNGGGAFVQLNSIASMKSFVDFATYAASKAASYSITQALRDAWKEQATQVVSVHPGPIATDMAETAGLTEFAEPPELVADAIFEALANETFHVFPDTMARQLGEAYQSFAAAVIESDPTSETA